MRLPTLRGGGRLWPAVLVASALLVGLAGHQLVAPRSLAADLPASTRLEDAQPGPTPTSTASSTAAQTAPPNRSGSRSTKTRSTETRTASEEGRRWRTGSADLPRTPRVVTPVRLVARTVGLDLPVEPQGVDEHGQMALPARPTELGWYRYGSSPADRRGAVVLAGHVDSDRYGRGPLVRAAGLRKGDEVLVRDDRGRTTQYVVSAVQRISKSDFDGADVFTRHGEPVLRLITCGGAYLPDRGGYQDNLVVTAERR